MSLNEAPCKALGTHWYMLQVRTQSRGIQEVGEASPEGSGCVSRTIFSFSDFATGQ